MTPMLAEARRSSAPSQGVTKITKPARGSEEQIRVGAGEDAVWGGRPYDPLRGRTQSLKGEGDAPPADGRQTEEEREVPRVAPPAGEQ